MDKDNSQEPMITSNSPSLEKGRETRASWNHWDIIHTVIILAITGAFYWYFW